MQLKDLIDKPVKEMTDDELEFMLHSMKKLRVQKPDKPKREKAETIKLTGRAKPAVKSNKEKQLNDLLNQLSPDDLQQLILQLSEGK